MRTVPDRPCMGPWATPGPLRMTQALGWEQRAGASLVGATAGQPPVGLCPGSSGSPPGPRGPEPSLTSCLPAEQGPTGSRMQLGANAGGGRQLPGSPVVRIQCFPCRGPGHAMRPKPANQQTNKAA